MSSYIPDYLRFNNRQADGWPNGVSEIAKDAATGAARRALLHVPHASLHDVQRAIFGDGACHPEFRGVTVFEYMDAVAHRALLAVGARYVWTTAHEKKPPPEKPAVLVDVGGGSATVYTHGDVLVAVVPYDELQFCELDELRAYRRDVEAMPDAIWQKENLLYTIDQHIHERILALQPPQPPPTTKEVEVDW